MTTNLPATNSFGYVRSFILETVVALRDKKMDIGTGMAIAANVKVLNDNVFAEVAAAKLSIATNGQANNFGQVMRMGTQVIGLAAPVEDNVKP